MLIRGVKLAALCIGFLTGAAVLAQEVQEVYPLVTTAQAVVGPSPWYFFLAIVVGVILAVSFELILTHLSVAAGISSVGPFDERGKPKEKPAEPKEGEGAVMGAVRKSSSLFGIWALVTATISLFFASWLAVELSHSSSAFIGFVLGLSIWALFYIIMTAIEISAVTSLVGALTHTAAEGLRSAYKATTAIFGKSEEGRIVDTAEKVTAAVREELFGDVDTDRIRKQIEDYLRNTQKDELNPEGIRRDIQRLFDDPKAGADALIRRLKAMDRDTLKAIIASRKDVSDEDAEHIVSQMERARDETIARYEQMRDEVQHRLEDAKERALREAEETRKAARNAAWWTFGSAVVSACAAIIGGILSTYT